MPDSDWAHGTGTPDDIVFPHYIFLSTEHSVSVIQKVLVPRRHGPNQHFFKKSNSSINWVKPADAVTCHLSLITVPIHAWKHLFGMFH